MDYRVAIQRLKARIEALEAASPQVVNMLESDSDHDMRDRFAAAALTGLLATLNDERRGSCKVVVATAYKAAEAMMQERKKRDK